MATNRQHLTLERIRKLKAPESTQAIYVFDDDPPRLCVRITPAGAKSFVYSGKLGKAPIRVTIGSVDSWLLDEARAEARRLQTQVDSGRDPRQLKAANLAEAERIRKETIRNDVTVADAWTTYTEARKHKWSPRHLADHQNLAHLGGEIIKRFNRISEPGALAALMPRKLSEINAEIVKAWLKNEIARRPTQAALAYRLLRAFLNWCSDTPEYQGLTSSDSCNSRITRDYLPKQTAKDDCLQREQLPIWFGAVRAINNPVIAVYLQSVLLTGARREEIASLKWTDVDFRWNSLTIRDKIEGERTIPLCPYVSYLLATLPRRNEWVFSSPAAKSGRLQEPRIAHNQALSSAGLPPLSTHGLRRSFGTLSEWVECPSGVVAQIMGHKPSATAEKHYRVRPLDLLRAWHTKIEKWILEQAGIEQPINVTNQPFQLVHAKS